MDIDKVQRYPITFVVKTNDSTSTIFDRIKRQAQERFGVKAVVKRYMDCIEEVVTTEDILERFDEVLERGRLSGVMEEIVLQSRVEFNVEEEGEGALAFDEAVEEQADV